jgi:hypothetical protein
VSGDLLPVSLPDMIAEVERELALRERLYPEWKLSAGRIKRLRMDRQIEVMRALLSKLQGEYRELERLARQYEASRAEQGP